MANFVSYPESVLIEEIDSTLNCNEEISFFSRFSRDFIKGRNRELRCNPAFKLMQVV
jgi:hypothetical protein